MKALRLARHPLDCADDGQDDSGPASADAPGRAPVVAEGDGLQLRLASDSAIWVGVEEGSEAQVTARVRRLRHWLWLQGGPLGQDLQAGYATLLVRIDLRQMSLMGALERLVDLLRQEEAGDKAAHEDDGEAPARRIEIPVAYGGADGPDLADVAAHTRQTQEEVIARHAGAEYEVCFLGFAPGFPYLTGLPQVLATPRLPVPRARVAAGSVGIGGGQTGVYPRATAGGWRIVGRTDRALFAGTEATLRAGDRVRFRPVPAGALRPVSEGETGRNPALGPRAIGDKMPWAQVLAPGVQTTVQDLGRPGFGDRGVARAGAADPLLWRQVGRVLGNDEGAAALECTLRGPTLRVLRAGTVAALAAGWDVQLDGQPLALGRAVPVTAGALLSCGAVTVGLRGYLAWAGGVVRAAGSTLGSHSVDLWAGLGGGPLSENELLFSAQPGTAAAAGLDAGKRWDVARGADRCVLRVTNGVHADAFSRGAHARLTAATFVVTPQASRGGIRLQDVDAMGDGQAGGLAPRSDFPSLRTEGEVVGALQVPPGGQPILLGPERATTGGYPKIAAVIAADLWKLGQLRPGDRVRFVRVSFAQAARLWTEQRDALLREL